MRVIKRNGEEKDFCLDKITNAIDKANKATIKDNLCPLTEEKQKKVINTVIKKLEPFSIITVKDIQDIVEDSLIKHNCYDVAKAYIKYRENKKQNKLFNSIEEKAISLIGGTNNELKGDNANKKTDVNSSVRDYLAGIVCKSIATKTLPKHIIKAHEEGLIHYHDLDYSPVMHLHNCDLLNIKDMLLNGFQMGDVKIDTPKTFSTACNLVAQINLIVSGSQYGGATISWADLLPIVERSRKHYTNTINKLLKQVKIWIPRYIKNKIIDFFVKQDIHTGIKTYQYQILCHQSSNGQTPFVSNNLCLREAQTEQELKDLAFIIEEILKQRIRGVKDKSGQYISPLFPKLLYWQCEGLNVNEDDPYYYLTKLACQCVTKRMQPDFKSEKMCREIKKGQIIPSMGCRALLSEIWETKVYPLETKFHYQFQDNTNTYYKGAQGCNFNYNKEHKSYFGNLKQAIEQVEKENSDLTKIIINFRGNSGWVISHSEQTVTVLEPIVYGRWNEGVITLNLPMCALLAKQENKDFFTVLDNKLELCREALLTRHKSVCNIIAKNSPILWQYGALCREQADTRVEDIIKKYPLRQTISLGFAGLCETCWALLNKSNTSEEGQTLCKEILSYLNKKLEQWKVEDKLNYALYGTPEENLTFKFAKALQKQFGLIEHITDKDYIVNSYHIDPREPINAFEKLKIEGQYLSLVKGGAISYIEVPNLSNNISALEKIVRYMYDCIYYAEINTKLDVCYKCRYQGEIKLFKKDKKFVFTCPQCGNTDDNEMNCVRRICGYLGAVNSGNTNQGRLDDIYNRVLHVD